MRIGKLQVGRVTEAMFDENAYITHFDGQTNCLIVDPSFDTDGIEGYVDRHALRPIAILNTHGHADHIAGNAAMKARWPECPLIIGCGDAPKLQDPAANLSRPFGIDLVSPPADRTVADGESLEIGEFRLLVRHTPGHSSGHVVFIWKDEEHTVVIAGDVLFQGSIGRTDFPDGDFQQLEHSIRSILYQLPENTLVLPGHGPATTVGEEKESNPFVR